MVQHVLEDALLLLLLLEVVQQVVEVALAELWEALLRVVEAEGVAEPEMVLAEQTVEELTVEAVLASLEVVLVASSRVIVP